MTVLEQSAKSAALRRARADLRRGLAQGTLTLEQLLADMPVAIHGLPLFELTTWRRGWGRDKLRRLGARAVADRVNLAIAAGDAGQRTLDWLADRDREAGAYQRGVHFHPRGARHG